jgi:hypothetical protein
MKLDMRIVTYLLKARIVDSEDTSIDREQRRNNTRFDGFMRPTPRPHNNSEARNHRGTVESYILHEVRAYVM